MKAEEAMFKAQNAWKRLSAMNELEQAVHAATEMQRQALERQEAARHSDNVDTMSQAQDQAMEKQRLAAEAFEGMIRRMPGEDVPDEMKEGLESAKQAQQQAIDAQAVAANARRGAERARQIAQSTQEQARRLADQAKMNPAMQEQANQAAAAAAQAKQAEETQMQAAQQTQDFATAAQQRAARRTSNVMAATQSARESQKVELRKQAEEAVATAASALRQQALALAEKVDVPLAEMPSANAARRRPDESQTPSNEATREAKSQGESGQTAEAMHSPRNLEGSVTEEGGGETPEDDDIEMDDLTDDGHDSLFPAWFRFRGFRSGEAEAEGWKDVPPECRGLVRDYFRKLSEEENSRE